ncbi:MULTISPECIES: hypothetical protein [unclassified Undibacterium]|uniref:hypothetical protein n=1 Tax=unclassified Undibacterium TaxID=2630295 RepID=UPI002AC8FDCF|nr:MULTISPECIES: hypothetical protein [unclassified Undibacterium]MEB0137633.1 hypothetical protein [Undibacterium sp. CCC2.1]MEB0170634.1 hypothetical protein [Undibacterium sp. CCC1.1]MEB0174575.1 hypothetical protein [Undibacterium sp. CCC3.4]MEB0213628.1 hypothetical protein [Undibacterium sp. 5I2]WPX43797.1 hypothetical protein RHM61_00745 [Undibacterium sp. CCC3.4]
MKKIYLSGASLCFLLAACGGGSSTSTAPVAVVTPVVTLDAVTSASAATASQLGLSALTGNSSTASVYDLVADVGDSWRLTLNQDGSFSIRVLSTQYGLSDLSGTYSKTTSGSLVTLTGANGSFDLKLDTRTSTLVGRVKLGAIAATVTGSSYALPASLSNLAGIYNFIGKGRNASNGGSPSTVAGTISLDASGKSVTVCVGGQANANGTCSNVSTQTAAQAPVTLTVQTNNADGRLHLQQNGSEFGTLTVQAGDRGAVLVFDHYGYNTDTPPVMRSGALYAVKQQALTGSELNGSWDCADAGTAIASLSVSGSVIQATLLPSTTAATNNLSFNKVNDANNLFSINGFAVNVASGDSISQGALVLPLSSSLFAVERVAAKSVALCRLSK